MGAVSVDPAEQSRRHGLRLLWPDALPQLTPLGLSRIDRDVRFTPDNALIPALSGPPLLRRIAKPHPGKEDPMAEKAIGPSLGRKRPWGGLWTARTPKTCLLLPDAVLRVFHETNTIFRNTRTVLNAADVARAAAFNVVQAAEAV